MEQTKKAVPVKVAPVEYGMVSIPIRSTGIVSTSEGIKLSLKPEVLLNELMWMKD